MALELMAAKAYTAEEAAGRMVGERDQCKSERASHGRVVHDASDERLFEE